MKTRGHIQADILDLFEGCLDWHCQCPPERRGAEIALFHCLGMGWEEANKFTFDGSNTRRDYLEKFKELQKRELKHE